MGENDPSAPARYMAQPSTMRSQDIRRQDLAAIQRNEVSSIDVPATLPPQHTQASGLVGPCLQQATSPSVETHQPNDSGAGPAVLEQRPLIAVLPASEPWEQPSINTLPSPTANARASRLFRERRKERERVLRQTVAELADRNAALEALLFHHGIVPPGLRQDLSIHRSQRRGGPPMHIPGVTTSLPTGLQSLPTTQQSGRASSASGSGSRDHDFSSGSSRDSSDCFRRTAPDLRTAQQTPCEPMLQASGMVMPRPTAVSASAILYLGRLEIHSDSRKLTSRPDRLLSARSRCSRTDWSIRTECTTETQASDSTSSERIISRLATRVISPILQL